MKRFDRLCTESYIKNTNVNFNVTQDKLFKFFRNVIRDCENEQNHKIMNKTPKKAPVKAKFVKKSQKTKVLAKKQPIKKKNFTKISKVSSKNNAFDDIYSLLKKNRKRRFTVKEISEETSWSVRTVQDNTKRLNEVGLIAKDKKKNKTVWLVL